jgi:hypothetical protein
VSTPTAQLSDPWVIGTALDLLSQEQQTNVLSVVAEPVMFSNSTYALVLRNGYSTAVALEEIYGTVREPGGSLLATVDRGVYAPAVIEPGAVCLVAVTFDSELSPAEQDGSVVELEYETKSDLTDVNVANLKVADFSVRPDRIVGVVENPGGVEVSAGWVVGLIFHSTGEIATWFATTVEKFEIEPSGTSTFSESFDVGTDISKYPYLVAAQGSAW